MELGRRRWQTWLVALSVISVGSWETYGRGKWLVDLPSSVKPHKYCGYHLRLNFWFVTHWIFATAHQKTALWWRLGMKVTPCGAGFRHWFSRGGAALCVGGLILVIRMTRIFDGRSWGLTSGVSYERLTTFINVEFSHAKYSQIPDRTSESFRSWKNHPFQW